MRRGNRLLRLAFVVGLVWVLAGIPAGSSAQSASGLGGFQIDTVGSAVSMIYVDPDSPIPASPTGEMHGGYSLAQIETGPSGHGVAAAMWPGETPSTAPPFVEQTFWQEFRSGWEDGAGQPPPDEFDNPNVVPRWPLAAESFEPQGPNQQSVPPNAETTSQGEYSFSEAKVVPLEIPGVFAVGGGGSSSLAETGDIELDDGRKVPGAVSQARAVASDISILGGFVTIDSVTTSVRVTSDGEAARLAGRTSVSGLKIAGQSFVIDHDGIHAGGETHDEFNPVLGQIRENGETALADQGVTMILAESIDTVSGAQGSRTLGGLVVRLDSRRFDEAISAFPDEFQRQFRGRMSTDHTLTLVFGSVAGATSAAPEFSFDEVSFDFSGGVTPSGGFSGTVAAPAPPSVLNSSPLPSISPAPGGTFVPVQPAFAAPIQVDGVGAGTALVAIALVLAAARGLHAMSGALLGGTGAGGDCTT